MDVGEVQDARNSNAQRIEQFRSLGVGIAGVLHFPDIRDLSAREFSERVLADALVARRVVVGADFRFGKGREGDCDFLRQEGDRLGFVVDVVDMFGALDGVVSSTRIRQALLAGDVEAAQMLDPALSAQWDRGRGRPAGGTTSAFPPPISTPDPATIGPGERRLRRLGAI